MEAKFDLGTFILATVPSPGSKSAQVTKRSGSTRNPLIEYIPHCSRKRRPAASLVDATISIA